MYENLTNKKSTLIMSQAEKRIPQIDFTSPKMKLKETQSVAIELNQPDESHQYTVVKGKMELLA